MIASSLSLLVLLKIFQKYVVILSLFLLMTDDDAHRFGHLCGCFHCANAFFFGPPIPLLLSYHRHCFHHDCTTSYPLCTTLRPKAPLPSASTSVPSLSHSHHLWSDRFCSSLMVQTDDENDEDNDNIDEGNFGGEESFSGSDEGEGSKEDVDDVPPQQGQQQQPPSLRHGNFLKDLVDAYLEEYDTNGQVTGELWTLSKDASKEFYVIGNHDNDDNDDNDDKDDNDDVVVKSIRFKGSSVADQNFDKERSSLLKKAVVVEEEVEDKQRNKSNDDDEDDDGDCVFIERMKNICDAMDDNANSIDDFRELFAQVSDLGLWQGEDIDYAESHLVRVNLEVRKDSNKIQKMIGNGKGLYLQLQEPQNDGDYMFYIGGNPFTTTKKNTADFKVVILGDTDELPNNNNSKDAHYEVSLFVSMFSEDAMGGVNDFQCDIYEDDDNTEILYPSMDRVYQKYEQNTAVEGVVVADDIVNENLAKKLKHHIDDFADYQTTMGRLDYHPHSNNVVRDIVHPALYPYVKNVTETTPFRARVVEDAEPTNLIPDDLPSFDSDLPRPSPSKSDYWGRPYEDAKYQWLPTYFSISKDGKCTIEDYINNLLPRDHHSDLYDSLAELFEVMIPSMESVYHYVRAIRPKLRDHDLGDYDEFGEEFYPLIEQHGYKNYSFVFPRFPSAEIQQLRDTKLQVITKIVDYELLPGQSYEGVFHVEGMSHEEIIMTCLYFPERSSEIVGAELQFERAFLLDEAWQLYVDSPQYGEFPQYNNEIERGVVPLGRVSTTPGGRIVVFPNSHIHKVTKTANTNKDTTNNDNDGSSQGMNIAKRRIVAFFVVNPFKRIVSTREVPPQQEYVGGTMEFNEAKHHRIQLMKDRKYHKQDWNVRSIQLCEH